MPRFDGTGPRGQGPMTGGARGYCNSGWTGYGQAGPWSFGPRLGRGRSFSRDRWPGFGRGRGYGRGFGWRGASPPGGSWFAPVYEPYDGTPYAMSRDDQINMLKEDAQAFKNELDAINKRIQDMESQAAKS